MPFLDMQSHVWQSSRAGRPLPVPLASQPQGLPAATSPPAFSVPSLPALHPHNPYQHPRHRHQHAGPSHSSAQPPSAAGDTGGEGHVRVILGTKPLCSGRKPSWLTSFVEVIIDHNSLEKQQEVSGGNEATPHTTLAHICSWGPNPGTQISGDRKEGRTKPH